MKNPERYEIAIIGMAGRFPQAPDLEQFWQLLAAGQETVVSYSDTELIAAGVDPAVLQHPDYVKAGNVIEGFDTFDAGFFDISEQDAVITDPQQRLLMECVWHALEHAGYAGADDDLRIGLYAGVGDNGYLSYYLEPHKAQLQATVGEYRISILGGKDFVATRIAYKLGLTGPAVTVQTACSTSLVAVHIAAQSLLNMECDIALAGAASLQIPARQGYVYQEGMILSPDARCRAFDAQAQGTFAGNGVGVVVLKRLEDALADRDSIHAVIRGSAINNDGHRKVGYTAPSVQGQAEVIADALAMAEVHPEQISYVEAHGTATPLGDPIEISALTRAFRRQTAAKAYCAIGSVKTNIGHADTAAGMAGLLKTVLALQHRQIPASLHFQQPNPQIDFANSPFYVNQQLAPWPSDGDNPRCAGVSAFGIGGTNAHVIVAQAPPVEDDLPPIRTQHLLCWSAKTPSALTTLSQRLAAYLHDHPDACLADVAYTLQRGRRHLAYRRALVCHDHADAIQQLSASDPSSTGSLSTGPTPQQAPSIAFLFPGQGSQYLSMGRELYAQEPRFRAAMDQCAALLMPHLQHDIRHVIFSDDPADAERLQQTQFTQSALFAVEYAIAQCWMAWGIQPDIMLGHSIGEYVAACLAEVMTLADALALVAVRGRLMQALPPAAMLAVPLAAEAVQPWLNPDLSLSVVNGAQRCVVGGRFAAIEQLQQNLAAQGIDSQRLQTSHAFHSHLLEPVLVPFAEQLHTITLHPPKRPFLSNLTGLPIEAQQAMSVDYWLDHLRHTVQFHAGLSYLFESGSAAILLEVGPRQGLLALARQHPQRPGALSLVGSMPQQPQAADAPSESRQLLQSLGQLWTLGAQVDWSALTAGAHHQRIPLPTYPFEGKRYWLDVSQPSGLPAMTPAAHNNSWLYRPLWVRRPLALTPPADPPSHWLVLADRRGSSQGLQDHLRQQGHRLTLVYAGTRFSQQGDDAYVIDPRSPDAYQQLVTALAAGGFPQRILHAWLLDPDPEEPAEFATGLESTDHWLQQGFYSLLYMLQAMNRANIHQACDLHILGERLFSVMDSDQPIAAKAAVSGVLETLQQEMPQLRCCAIDIEPPVPWEHLVAELLAPIDHPRIAYRRQQRWLQSFEQLQWQPQLPAQRLRPHGVYLITGGLGGIGLTLAIALAETVQARLILIARHTTTDPAIAQRLQAIEQKGGEYLIIQADVSNEAQLRQAIEQGEQHFSTIQGVLHAAGVADGALIAQQTASSIESVFAPKIAGTLLLHRLLLKRPLDFFVLCSSLSSVLGAAGQIAYCVANGFQDAFAQAQRHHPTTLFTAINWDTWQTVGMAVAARQRRASRPDTPLSVTQASQPDTPVSQPDTPMTPLDHPLFQGYRQEGEQVRYTSRLDAGYWVLDEHRVMGHGSVVMPGTGYLEWTRAALVHHLALEMETETKTETTNHHVIQWHEVSFLQPLIIDDGTARILDILLSPVDEGDSDAVGFDVVVSSHLETDATASIEHVRARLCATAAASPEALPEAPLEVDESVETIGERCGREVWYVAPDLSSKAPEHCNPLEQTLLAYGPHWHHLRQVSVGDREGLAYLALPYGSEQELAAWPLHPGLLDMALGFLGLAGDAAIVGIPFGYEQVVLYRPLPARLYSHARLRPATTAAPHEYRLDITLLDEQDQLIMRVTGYILRTVKSAPHPGKTAGRAADQNPEQTTDSLLSPQALTPEEGSVVFLQVLQHGEAQILATKEALPLLLAQARQAATVPAAAPTANRPTMERPGLSNRYVPPTTDLEHRLVIAWQQFLGIEPIGITDDFFALGGDSLLAIQLVAALRTELRLDLAAQALLNTPTIRGLVALLQADTQDRSASPVIHIKAGDPRHPPLFLLHPVGGHIVHYRLLAKYLAPEQPVFAIQAQGLDGHGTPIDDVQTMAEQYLAHIKTLQPQGPYLLCGYSSGGMTAYEMAQQLTRRGEAVALLAMIDTGWPDSIIAYGPDDDIQVMVDLLQLSQAAPMSIDELSAMDPATRWRHFVAMIEGDDHPQSQQRVRAFMQVFRANTKAIANYKPEPWHGSALFLRAMHYPADQPKLEEEWGRLIEPAMTTRYIDANHVTMMTDKTQVRHIATHLQHSIRQNIPWSSH